MNNKQLEKNMISYQNLRDISVKENKDTFMVINSNVIPIEFIKGMDDMKTICEGNIFIRKEVYKKLCKIQNTLTNIYPDLSLCITYGYRSLEVQIKKFQEQLSIISQKNYFEKSTDLYEEVHRYIAVPSVSGHPTGGAVDVIIKNITTGKMLDFGSQIYDFSTKKSYVFSSFVSKESKHNRLLLRKLMIEEGFAPYDGEWWHFSYGDKEWAYYYKQKYAIYDQVSYSEIKNKL